MNLLYSLTWPKELPLKKASSVLLFILCAGTISAQQNLIDSLTRIVSLQRHDTVEFHALLGLTNEYLRKDIQQAKKFALRVVSLADTPQEARWLSGAYNYLITCYQQSGGLDSAHYFIQTSEKLVQQHPENARMKYNYNQAVSLFYKNIGDYKKALPYMLENLNDWKKEDENKAGQLLNLGNLYINLGEFKKAADSHLQSLRLFEKIGSKRGQSFCLNSLGNDYMDLKQYAVAEKYILQSEKLKEELGDKRGVLNSWMGLGIVYQQTNKAELSMLYFNKALTQARELKLVLEEARALFNMGSLLKQEKKNDEAIQKFSEALPLARQLGDSSLVLRIKTYQIALQTDAQTEIKKEQTLLQNIKISAEAGALDNTAEAHFMLAEWYASRKQFDKAYENYKQGQRLTDSIQGNQVILQLKKLEEEYNTEKKEKEIALLKKDQELQTLALSRERTNVILIAIALFSVIIIGVLLINRYRIMNRARRMLELEQMRNHIARDLHDDIGSTLSSINIMSQLALRENGHAGNHLNKIASHSASMMEKMSDIVWSINPKNDSLEQVVTKMKEFSAEILEPKNIDYAFHIEETIYSMKLNAEKRKNIFLIFKEAVNNAAKYSEGTKVTISLSVKNQQLYLMVRDNGKGFNPGLGTTGNGLKNMEDRAVAMQGKLIRTSEPATGTNIQLEIPIT